MSDILKASHDLQVLAARLKPLFEVAEALERIGSLEDAERSAIQRTTEAKAKEAKAIAELTTATNRLLEAERQTEKARGEAVSIIDEASAKASSIREDARTDAKGMVDAAITAKHGILQEIEERKMDMASLKSQIAAKEKELAAITKQITSTKEKIAALAG